MNDPYEKVFEDLDAKLHAHFLVGVDLKKGYNLVCGLAGRPLRFSDDELAIDGVKTASASGSREIKRNEFYGKPLAACVRDILQRRASAGMVKEATLEEIIAALEQGNYDLKRHGSSRDAMCRGVAISLAKNNKTFHKLPHGDFGLAEWYNRDSLRREKKGPAKTTGESDDLDFEESMDADGSDFSGDEANSEQQEADETVSDEPFTV